MGLTFIKALPADGDSSLDFVDGTDDVVMDNTYNEYQFYFVNIQPDTNADILSFQVDVVDGTTYDQSITSTTFEAENDEGDTGDLQYRSNRDQANDAEYQQLSEYIYNSAGDESASGVLTLYDPSNPTYLKHWMSVVNAYGNDVSQVSYHAGYIHQTSAIDRIRFAMTINDMSISGNISTGTIYMYGVS
jgi:hypothetical protein|tara:strand:- start:209 stop:775 length:567 start_codon:yes stop_codon:yes gene_type:complete